jgi:sulfoxide reductase heme-binding subunit YedZ
MLITGACLVTPFVVALAFDSRPFGVAPWYLSRAFGIVAFLLLSAATISGLLVSSKTTNSFPGRVLVFKAHQFSSVASVAVIALHVEVLLFDGLLKLSPLQLVVPFVAPYRHFLPSAGVISAWLTIVVTGSFMMRRKLGRKRWRALHYGSFGGYVLALVHGFAAGPDTEVTLMSWTYILSSASVVVLLSYRIAAALRRDAGRRIRQGGRAQGVSPGFEGAPRAVTASGIVWPRPSARPFSLD